MKISSVLLLGLALPLAAHHGSAAYDKSHIVTMTGVVEEVSWLNPHVEITLHVTGEDGKQTTWTIEAPPPNTLRRLGWQKDDLKSGDGVTMLVWVARDGGTQAAMRSVTFPDGHTIAGLPSGWKNPITNK